MSLSRCKEKSPFLCANFLGINSSIDSYHYLKILSLRLAIQNWIGQLCRSFSLTPLKNFGITNASFKHLIHVFKSALILWASHFDIVWNLIIDNILLFGNIVRQVINSQSNQLYLWIQKLRIITSKTKVILKIANDSMHLCSFKRYFSYILVSFMQILHRRFRRPKIIPNLNFGLESSSRYYFLFKI